TLLIEKTRSELKKTMPRYQLAAVVNAHRILPILALDQFFQQIRNPCLTQASISRSYFKTKYNLNLPI
ncbi:MAG: hypothetical protein QF569_22610, partial [Candidatus Poribacteria bacterium]|nr:hypothetical protein [Candidatus Poribacteria bacterium]